MKRKIGEKIMNLDEFNRSNESTPLAEYINAIRKNDRENRIPGGIWPLIGIALQQSQGS